MTIKNVIFDFGNVIIDWNPEYLYETLFDTREEMDYFLTHICHMEWHSQQDAGQSFQAATEERLAAFPEHADMIKRFYGDWEKMFKGEIAENVALIQTLKDRGYRMFGLTNWPGEIFPESRKMFSSFAEFEGIVVSGIEKVVKPNPRIYEILLDRYNLVPQECFFIDDRKENIEGAEAFGIMGLHYIPGSDLKAQLEDANIL